jgi:hypothetical protein
MIILDEDCLNNGIVTTTLQGAYVVEEQDKTFTAYIQFGNFQSKEEANLYLCNFLNESKQKIVNFEQTFTMQ